MGNCATVTVGAYVETCVGKICSEACPNGSCPSGWACNSGVCNDPVTPGANCSISTNFCTPSCIDKSTCAQCPSKPGCTLAPPVDPCLGKLCSAACPYGVCFNGQTCTAGVCTGGAPVDPCLGKSCSAACPSGSCSAGQSCVGGTCTTLDTFDPHGCNTTQGYTWCPAKLSCQKICDNPDLDIYDCDKTKGETWCARTQRCHIEYTDPCNPIIPVGSDTPPGDVTPVETLTDTTGGMSPSIMALLGIALIGGFVMMSGKKG